MLALQGDGLKLFPSPDIGLFGRRQRRARGHRIPVTITLKARTADAGCAVVVDTFGADDVAPLPGGCACCTVRTQLQTALQRLSKGREKKPFNRVVIESPHALGPVLRTFVSEGALGGEYHVEDAPAHDGNRFVLTGDAPLSWDAFSRFMTTLAALRGTDLLDAKGLLNITGCHGPVAVQFMGHLAARPVELQGWPDDRRTSRIAFITRGIEEKMVRDLFDSVRALSSPSP